MAGFDVRIVLAHDARFSSSLLRELVAVWDGATGTSSEVVVMTSGGSLLAEVDKGLAAADGVVVSPVNWSDLRAVASAHAGSFRIVAVGMDDADAAPGGASAAWGLPVVRGRGLDGYRWASAWLRQRAAYPFEEMGYGEQPDQIADLRLPQDGYDPFPVAVFLHGGFWRERWVRDTIEPLAIDLAQQGFATLNVEYRRAGATFPGWRQTAGDVAAAIDRLASLDRPLDLSRVVLVGHSAGAQLAAWAIRRRPDGTATAVVHPAALVLLAGMVDLDESARRGLGDTSNPTIAYLGGSPSERREEYASASPHALLPLGVPQVVVQGKRDSPDLVDMARTYAERARALGDAVTYLEPDDGDHFTVITPSRPEWQATVTAVHDALRPQETSERP